ncbi:MAG: phenylalanine--tRNA ligase subunit alpha [Acidobacteria bacterium]|nr:phenylalanine--tRNA ligase subunit alpha [Acidobacteriota bacterium]
MSDLSVSVAALRAEFDTALAAVATAADLQALRDRFLSRKHGLVTALYGEIARAPVDQKREIGRLANELKQAVEAGLEARRETVASGTRTPGLDLTLAARPLPAGSRHPLNAMRERIERIFTRMGYEIVDGPETEDDWHTFEALNMPADHPARDAQDTLYLERAFSRQPATGNRQPDSTGGRQPATGNGHPGGQPRPATLLRTHTSAVQVRYMEAHGAPVRIIAPGRVYRRDSLDLTHTPMFQQVEGLVVGEHVTMADLKGTLLGFAREFFDPKTPIMFKPSFFPYTEPSAEVFVGCQSCFGSGCPMCKRTGWIEIGGSGMVHPSVFEAVGIDPERYTGFAFGMGIERLALLAHRVDDIRAFYENDLRFLEQFAS